jgi:hypothetical protein
MIPGAAREACREAGRAPELAQDQDRHSSALTSLSSAIDCGSLEHVGLE